MNEATLALLAIFMILLILVTTPNPVRKAVQDNFRVSRYNRKYPPTDLPGSDRGDVRGYWGAPELYDRQTGYKCACHVRNKILRDGRCYQEYDRDGRGLEEPGLPTCH